MVTKFSHQKKITSIKIFQITDLPKLCASKSLPPYGRILAKKFSFLAEIFAIKIVNYWLALCLWRSKGPRHRTSHENSTSLVRDETEAIRCSPHSDKRLGQFVNWCDFILSVSLCLCLSLSHSLTLSLFLSLAHARDTHTYLTEEPMHANGLPATPSISSELPALTRKGCKRKKTITLK